MTKLRIAFFGTPDFAVTSLQRIVESGYQVVGVFTAPDKPSGRGRQIQFSEVKRYALEMGLPVYQPEKLKNPDFTAFYKSLNIDIAVVVAFRMLPELIWSAPSIGTINLHASLLPQYRGAAPINWAIINGETETGVTTFFINGEIDKGDILFQEKCAILPEDNFGTLYNKLKKMGADLIIYTLQQIEGGQYTKIEQEFSAQDKMAPKIEKDILEIKDFSSCLGLHNLIRGLIPVYRPYFTYRNMKYIIRSGYGELADVQNGKMGSVLSNNKDYVKLICTNGYYFITEIQPEGKRPMDIKSFLNGYGDQLIDSVPR